MSMDLARIVRFTNISNEDFTHLYHGQPFTIKAAESLLFPFDLGRHLSKHLARKILFSKASIADLKNDRVPFSNEDEGSLIAKILGEETNSPVSKALSEDEILRQRIAELNVNKPEGVLEGRTKADVIADMEKLNLPVDKRLSMAKLEEQLAEAKK